MEWIDLHAHLDRLEEGVEGAIHLAKQNQVKKIVTIGTEPNDLPLVLSIAQKHYPDVYCTLGVHPHDGIKYNQDAEKFILENIHHKEVVAVGEIGLDYYYNHSEKNEQLKAFRAQLEIAQKSNMPVEIHTRDAEQDTVDLLKEYPGVNGLIHCFTGTRWLAEQCLNLGFNISISGVVTFKNAHDLRETVKMIPLDRIHVETDAPFLAPVPMRGKQNTPAYVVHTAKVVAELKGITLEQLAAQTRQNAMKLFPKIVW